MSQKDSDWSDEEKVKDDRFSFLADMIGVGGPSFDDDDVIANNDDEDLRKDPVSQIDLRVSPSAPVFSLAVID
jgi:importin-9